LPVSAILQALSDETGCIFLVREYGILATMENVAPQGAEKVQDFLRQKPADEPRGNVGLLKDKGTLIWPQPLQGEAFKEAREKLNRHMNIAERAVEGSPIAKNTIRDLQEDLKRLNEILEASVSSFSSDQYIEAKRYLRLLNNTVTALKLRQPKNEEKPRNP
jgi:hypothetical protein